MEAYKAARIRDDGNYESVYMHGTTMCRTYVLGQDAMFDGEPGMAFEDCAHAQRFARYCDKTAVLRCEVDVSPLNGTISWVPAREAANKHSFWRHVAANTLDRWRTSHSRTTLPVGTVLCTRIRPIERVYERPEED